MCVGLSTIDFAQFSKQLILDQLDFIELIDFEILFLLDNKC